MPDLAVPVQAVGAAVENLVKVSIIYFVISASLCYNNRNNAVCLNTVDKATCNYTFNYPL